MSEERTLPAGTTSRMGASRLSWPVGMLALACAVCGAMLALHYPLFAPVATVVFGLVVVTAWFRPHAWLVFLPTLLPIIGFAPWTGWIIFEEFDMLVLAVAAGGYARRAWSGPNKSAPGPGSRAAALIGLMVALFAASTLLSTARGFADAGGFSFGWFQGYREPMNSLRLSKPFFFALLLWPLWQQAILNDLDRATRQLTLGMMLGLLGASLAALWERLAFTGLLNFSTDYRTTALFWEMHVGGAAFDGFLALTVPFAVRELLVAQTKARWIFAASVTALGAYACITTFSRGVYLAVPMGLGLMWALERAQQRRALPADRPLEGSAMATRLALTAAFVLAAAWMFPGSGYRGMLALIGAFAILLPLCATLRHATQAELVAGTCIGAVQALAAGGVAWLLPKGAYVVYGAGLAFSIAMLSLQRRAPLHVKGRYAALAWGGYLWVLTALALVAGHWGGHAALAQALSVVVLMFVAAIIGTFSRFEIWPQSLHWQGKTLGTMVLSGSLVAAFGGGAYMGERFATSQSDLRGRLTHWELSASMLDGIGDWALGKGLGRYVDSYAIAAPENLRPGDYRMLVDEQGRQLKLTGGGRLTGDVDKPMTLGGDILRMSQRIDPPVGRPRLGLDVRAARTTKLNVAVCNKHLLYPGSCLASTVRVGAKPGEWQRVDIELPDKSLKSGPWYAPRGVVFTIGVESFGGELVIDNLALADADGRNLLSNGDFSSDLRNWFFTSDRSHLPWHAKNMALNVLFDQGLLGLTLLVALAAGALWRVCLGQARTHSLAPSLAGASVGFLVVGMFDSLLDAPRVAFLWYSLLLVMLTLPGGPDVQHREGP
jgi:hypothetical protein